VFAFLHSQGRRVSLMNAARGISSENLSLIRFFLTFGASWQEAGEVRRVREVVQILLDHTSAA
jgi:hypothetical protein